MINTLLKKNIIAIIKRSLTIGKIQRKLDLFMDEIEELKKTIENFTVKKKSQRHYQTKISLCNNSKRLFFFAVILQSLGLRE